ncbi:uncharacterized protein J8A68_000345 [[Candida] subhashii]|uniref:Uncharacterized protein n=1 Tax=[Candida] subhashii TaxID=561895 RepID=A0A8J5QI71_9ASCO|nr:uncharacterized protein J8A68_000345 [[Candida] subhashii]KAG7666089.1 hypothetical protein J8A68_000345 [[Candida] subhashii]
MLGRLGQRYLLKTLNRIPYSYYTTITLANYEHFATTSNTNETLQRIHDHIIAPLYRTTCSSTQLTNTKGTNNNNNNSLQLPFEIHCLKLPQNQERPIVNSFLDAQNLYHIHKHPFYFDDPKHKYCIELLKLFQVYYDEITRLRDFIAFHTGSTHFNVSTNQLIKLIEDFRQTTRSRRINIMTNRLLELLDSSSYHKQLIRVSSSIEETNQILSLFEYKLDYFIDLIKLYYRKFNKFETISTLGDLSNCLRSDIECLSIPTKFNQQYFQSIILKYRVNKLIEILNEHSDTPISVLTKIINHPHLDHYIYILDIQSNSDHYSIGFVNSHYLNMLLNTGLIPHSHDYYQIAPKLYQLSIDTTQPEIINTAAKKVLEEWTSFIASNRNIHDSFHDCPLSKIYNVSSDIHVNYVFSSFLLNHIPLEKYIHNCTGNNDLRDRLFETFKEVADHHPHTRHYLFAYLTPEQFVNIFNSSRLIKYFKLRNIPLYNLFPKNSKVFKHIDKLESIRNESGKKFGDMNLSEFKHLIMGLEPELSNSLSEEYVIDNLYILDDLLDRKK